MVPPLDTEQPNSQEQVPSAQETPAVSNGGSPQARKARAMAPTDTQTIPPASQPDAVIEAFCSKIIINGWFTKREEFDNYRLDMLKQFALLETYANTKEPGFELKLPKQSDSDPDSTIKWLLQTLPDGNQREFIYGRDRGFSTRDADAIIALAAVRGWQPVHVHGNTHQKDLLWLAAMKQGLSVANYAPKEGSNVLKEWEEYQKNNVPGVSPDADGPAVSANADNKTPPPPEMPPIDTNSTSANGGNPAGDSNKGAARAQEQQQQAQSADSATATPPADRSSAGKSAFSARNGDLSEEFTPVAADTRQQARSQFIPGQSDFRELLKKVADARQPQPTGRHSAPAGTQRSVSEFISKSMADPTPRTPVPPRSPRRAGAPAGP